MGAPLPLKASDGGRHNQKNRGNVCQSDIQESCSEAVNHPTLHLVPVLDV